MGQDLGVDQGEVEPVCVGQGQRMQAGSANYHDLFHIACGGDGLFRRQGDLGAFSATIQASLALDQPFGPVLVGVLPGGALVVALRHYRR